MRPASPHDAMEALTAPDAQALFYDLADNSRIAFNYPKMGCNYRAYQMRGVLAKQGLEPWLVLAVEQKAGSPLRYQPPQGDAHEWWYHAAVALPVITETGQPEICVFDPGVYDGPVRVSDWAARIGARIEEVLVGRFDDVVLPAADSAMKRARLQMLNLDQETVYERTNEIFRVFRQECEKPRRVYPSHVRAEAERQVGYAFPRAGKSWALADQVDQKLKKARHPAKPGLGGGR